MKNILHLSETSEPGGSETILVNISKNIDTNEYRSHVCLLEEGWLSNQVQDIGINLSVIENKRSYDPIFLAKLISLIRQEKVDLIHAHEFMMNVYGSVAAKITSIPMIGTIHGKGYFTNKKSRILAYKLAISLCSQMIAVSENLRKYIIKELKLKDASKIVTMYNGIDLKKYSVKNTYCNIRNELGISSNTLIVGIVGSLFTVKGVSYLLEAVKEVVTCFPNFRLLIVGEGDQESTLKNKVISLGLQNIVDFLGFRNDIPEVLSLFDIYICSSLSEGLPLSVVEAMAASKPVVATNVGGLPEIVIDNETGYLVEPRNSAALAEKISILLQNKSLREQMGIRGRKITEEKFSLKTMIDNYQNLYKKLIK